jgi:hypothetical protein
MTEETLKMLALLAATAAPQPSKKERDQTTAHRKPSVEGAKTARRARSSARRRRKPR